MQRAGSAISSRSNTSDGFIERQLNELAQHGVEAINSRSQDLTSFPDDEGREEENVSVMVRCRPPIVSDNLHGVDDNSVVLTDEEAQCVKVITDNHNNTGQEREQQQVYREFYFDRVFSPDCNDEKVYMTSGRRLVQSAFCGYNCTIFLYGQTGTGKTHTHSNMTSNAFSHLFSLIRSSGQETRVLIRASYYELYNEMIRDLLSKNPTKALELKESKTRGTYIKDLSCFLVGNQRELENLKKLGDKRRSTASTQMNEHSSRSHSIFSITIETVSSMSQGNDASVTRRHQGGEARTGSEESVGKSSSKARGAKDDKDTAVRLGRLHLIDLAGSERQTKSGSSGARLKEASRINLSLTCLSLVINALTDKNSSHIPYRNSKLTRLLSSSLGGNSKTLLIACIAPEKSNLEETLSTLRFASRTKLIKNKASINEDPKDALLRKYRQQINELRQRLREEQGHERGSIVDSDLLAPGQENSNQQTGALTEEELAKQRQLELLREKIMVGGENLLEKMELHEKLLEASRQELEEKRQHERKLRAQLEEKNARLELVRQSKDTLETQKQRLESSFERAVMLYKRSKLEQRDLTVEHDQLKDSLLQDIRATSKEIKFVDCIIEDFIPRKCSIQVQNPFFLVDFDAFSTKLIIESYIGIHMSQLTITFPRYQPIIWTSSMPMLTTMTRLTSG